MSKKFYILLDNYYEGIDQKLKIEDKFGYRYYISMHQFYSSARYETGNYQPQRFAGQNPFSIDNIKLWLNLNNKPFTFYDGKFINNNTKNLYFKCDKCQEIWNNQWAVISMGIGCPYCNGKRVSANNNLETHRPDLVTEWDYDKNKNLSPTKVSFRSEKLVWWICTNCGFNWRATISNRNNKDMTKSTNCPRCNRSHGERKIEDWLIFNNKEYQSEYSFEDCKYKKPLPFDFYLEFSNCCIEFQGRQHYMPVNFGGSSKEVSKILFEEQQIKDKIKEKYCKENNILLIKIPYWEYRNIEGILSKL